MVLLRWKKAASVKARTVDLCSLRRMLINIECGRTRLGYLVLRICLKLVNLGQKQLQGPPSTTKSQYGGTLWLL